MASGKSTSMLRLVKGLFSTVAFWIYQYGLLLTRTQGDNAKDLPLGSSAHSDVDEPEVSYSCIRVIVNSPGSALQVRL